MVFYKRSKAQSAIEYAMLAAVVALAFTAMFHYAKRATFGKLKVLEQQINRGQEEEGLWHEE